MAAQEGMDTDMAGIEVGMVVDMGMTANILADTVAADTVVRAAVNIAVDNFG